MPKLVIVESPAKAKTIGQFLGPDYQVEASFGHVRDLPERADEIPADMKKLKWAKLGVNVEENFEPLYIVPDDKKRHVETLKKAAKGATELLLATDEDREGESISWHILQVLKPSAKTKVSRIVFHEITPEAIQAALASPRQVDENLVRAQETRRILDRLYGYTLSPLLWKKVAPKLSAGRVQSVAVRLTVDRERQRMTFVSAKYWDLEAELKAKAGSFKARLTHVGDQRVATGSSFDPNTGEIKEAALWIREEHAQDLLASASMAEPWKIAKLESKEGVENPPAPFMTSTLQQEAGRKLRLTAKRTMQIAQNLYEGVDLGGERVGLITYMRTDSLNLADRALDEARTVIGNLFGKEYLPAKPVKYKTKARGAQEAHEAIRPTDLARTPQDVKKYLDNDQFALYELIWKRTIACQMKPAEVLRTSVDVAVDATKATLNFRASGKQIVFPGFLRAYVEGSDDPDAELGDRETVLPAMKQGDIVDLLKLEADMHETKPPARYTEASLVKKLEEEGIGRPSTYASIISTIQDRGYVNKKGTELIPTFTAFAVTDLLENNFSDVVDLRFTAKMEDQLDEIADGKRDSVKHLSDFYRGNSSHLGLEREVKEKEKDIPYPSLELGKNGDGEPVVIRVGRFGAFVQIGEGGEGKRATIHAELAPAEVDLEKALQLIREKNEGPEAISVDPSSGQCVFVRGGRFGDYLEVAQTDEEKASGAKPRRVTLPKGMKARDVTEEIVPRLLQFPRNLGNHPSLGEPVTVQLGQYGPYVRCGSEIRNVDNWETAADLSMDEAVALLAAPKVVRGRTTASTEVKPPIQEFGKLEGAQGNVRVLEGRYGPYVTDGKTNATLPKGIEPTEISANEALKILLERAKNPVKKKSFRRTAKR